MKIPSFLSLLLCLALPGCSDTSFDPFENDEQYFTIYGFLDQLETQHKVRVIPITRNQEHIDRPSDEHRIDGRVFSTDNITGIVREWTHSFEQLDNGEWGHIFRARFSVNPGRTYRLEVVRQDGKMAWAETRVPAITEAAIFQKGPVTFNADSTRATQTIAIPGVPSVWDVNAIYLLNNLNDGQEPGGGALQAFFFVPYGRVGVRTSVGGWRFEIDLTRDTEEVRRRVAEFRAQGAYDQSPESPVAMGAQIRILDQNWDPPEGVFDPEVLAQPGTMSNVENGLGLFGSIGVYREEWPVDRALALSLGYEW